MIFSWIEDLYFSISPALGLTLIRNLRAMKVWVHIRLMGLSLWVNCPPYSRCNVCMQRLDPCVWRGSGQRKFRKIWSFEILKFIHIFPKIPISSLGIPLLLHQSKKTLAQNAWRNSTFNWCCNYARFMNLFLNLRVLPCRYRSWETSSKLI